MRIMGPKDVAPIATLMQSQPKLGLWFVNQLALLLFAQAKGTLIGKTQISNRQKKQLISIG